MSKLVEVQLTNEMKKDLALRLATAVNDEIESLDAIMSSYSSDEYFRSAAETIKTNSICNRVSQLLKDLGYFGCGFTLVFRRRPPAGITLQHTYCVTTIRGLETESSLEHSLAAVNIPYDQFEAQGLYSIPEGTYSLCTITEGPYREVEEEEQPTDNKTTESETPVEVTDESEVVTEDSPVVE